MQTPKPLMIALLLVVAALAGCAESGDGGDDGSAAGTTPATSTTTSPTGTTPRTTGGAVTPTGSDGETAGGEDVGADWYAFAFDRDARTADGETGRIASFSYTNTREESNGRQVVSVRVTHEGTVTEPVRTQKFDFASGNYEPEIVSTDLTMHKLRHEVTIVEDTTGRHDAGETATVTLYLPVDVGAREGAYAWFFTKLAFDTSEGQGAWEYHLTPEMAEEMEGGGASYLPFVEGEDAASWWGFEFMATTYGLGAFSGYATGEQEFEEGSWSYGGVSYSAERTTFRIGSHEFRGWSVTTTSAYDGSSSSSMLKVSPDLPIPVAYRFASQGQGSNAEYAYELTDIELE